MKKIQLFSMLLAAAAAFTGCDDAAKTETGTIAVEDEKTLTQTVFADQLVGKSEVKFTTSGAWTSKALKIGGTRDTPPAEWVSIDPDHGDEEGEYTVLVTLEPNRTGADRMAVITIMCDGSQIKINVTQKGIKEDGTSGAVLLEDVLDNYKDLFYDVEDAFNKIDGQYWNHNTRKQVSASTEALSDFWNSAYEAIDYCNMLMADLEDIDLEDIGIPAMTEEQKNTHIYTAMKLRATAYFYLVTLFGDVPLSLDTENPASKLPRTSAPEIKEFVDDSLLHAAEELPQADENECRLIAAKLLMTKTTTEYLKAAEMLQAVIESGAIGFRDTNGDGLINAQDSDALFAAQTYLLAADAFLETNNIRDAHSYVNIVYTSLGQQVPLPDNATKDEIRSAMRNAFNVWNKGVKFMNEAHWNGTADWGKYALMPIPQQAMNTNKYLTQNSGW